MKVRANGGDLTFDAGTDPTGQQRWGDSISIALAEPNTSAAVWTLDVYMQGTQGRYFLDQVVTVPPTQPGGRASRIVAIARCPGALHWFVYARCLNDPTAECEIMIEASREGSGGSAGVYAPVTTQPIGNLQGPAPALAADATANPTVSKIGTYGMALNGNGTWDRLRSGLLGVYAQMVGWLNVLPGVRYLAGAPVLNPGEVTNLQGDTRGSVKVTDTASDGNSRNFPDAAPSADGTLNISATRIGAFASAINAGGAWDRLRAGIVGVVATVVGWLNVLPGLRYLAGPPAVGNGEFTNAQCDARGTLKNSDTSSDGTTRNFPDAAAMQDAAPNATATRVGAWLSALNGGGTWDRVRSGLVAVQTTFVGLLNTLPLGRYNTTAPTLADGNVAPFQSTTRGDLKVAEQFEYVVFDLSGNSPSAAAAGTAGADTGAVDLAGFDSWRVVATLQGATGGTLDTILQGYDGASYWDWIAFTQRTAAAAASSESAVPGLPNVGITVGKDLVPLLAAGAIAGGIPGTKVRVCWKTGAGTSAGAAQVIKLIGRRRRI